MSAVRKSLVTPLLRHFAIPEHIGDETIPDYLADYDRALGNFLSGELETAANALIATFEGRTFPPVAACVRACNEARNRNESRTLAQPAIPRQIDWSPSSMARADELMNTPIGRRAAHQGWILRLWDFCRVAGRVPNDLEAAKLRSEHRAQQADLRDKFEGDMKAGRPMPFAISKLFEGRANRERRLCELATSGRSHNPSGVISEGSDAR